MEYRVVTPPEAEPISVDEARDHLNLSVIGGNGHPHDGLIALQIAAARKIAERITGLAIGVQTREVALTEWFASNEALELPGGATAITSIKYRDTAGVEQTVSPAVYFFDDYLGRVQLASDARWPDYKALPSGIRVRYVAGSATVDEDIIAAMLLIVGHLYLNRENVTSFENFEIPMGAQDLLQLSRVNMGV